MRDSNYSSASFQEAFIISLQANHLPRIQISPTNQRGFRGDDVLPVDLLKGVGGKPPERRLPVNLIPLFLFLTVSSELADSPYETRSNRFRPQERVRTNEPQNCSSACASMRKAMVVCVPS